MSQKNIMRSVVTLIVSILMIVIGVTCLSKHIEYLMIEFCGNRLEKFGQEATDLVQKTVEAFAAHDEYRNWIVQNSSNDTGVGIRVFMGIIFVVCILGGLILLSISIKNLLHKEKTNLDILRNTRRSPRRSGHN